jgi:hypothetical protein
MQCSSRINTRTIIFLIYVNDICDVSDTLELISFADDTNEFFSHNDLHVLTNTINTELLKFSEWFKANKL